MILMCSKKMAGLAREHLVAVSKLRMVHFTFAKCLMSVAESPASTTR